MHEVSGEMNEPLQPFLQPQPAVSQQGRQELRCRGQRPACLARLARGPFLMARCWPSSRHSRGTAAFFGGQPLAEPARPASSHHAPSTRRPTLPTSPSRWNPSRESIGLLIWCSGRSRERARARKPSWGHQQVPAEAVRLPRHQRPRRAAGNLHRHRCQPGPGGDRHAGRNTALLSHHARQHGQRDREDREPHAKASPTDGGRGVALRRRAGCLARACLGDLLASRPRRALHEEHCAPGPSVRACPARLARGSTVGSRRLPLPRQRSHETSHPDTLRERCSGGRQRTGLPPIWARPCSGNPFPPGGRVHRPSTSPELGVRLGQAGFDAASRSVQQRPEAGRP